jgi:hypothetical protein
LSQEEKEIRYREEQEHKDFIEKCCILLSDAAKRLGKSETYVRQRLCIYTYKNQSYVDKGAVALEEHSINQYPYSEATND